MEHLRDNEPGATGSSAKYWRMAAAIEALGTATVAEVEAWERTHYPSDPRGDVRADLEHLTVNSASRPHYDGKRTNWRSDSGHTRDRLFKVVDTGPPRRTRYVLFDPAVHGHWDLRKINDRKWEVISLALDELARADAEGLAAAFSYRPPIDGEHDARVQIMRAVHLRRGQPQFRAQLLDAYGSKCAITGCSAIEVLEAAHVLPYRGDHTDRVDNALLLRADLHTLFDCQLLWITAELTVALAPTLLASCYAELQGHPLTLPRSRLNHPNPAHLAEHARRCQFPPR